jgi:hypothetical protein
MEYVSRVTLEVNGQSIDDFKTVTEKEFEIHKEIKLMNKTGYAETTPRYGVEVEYVVPKSSPEFDWKSVKDGTLTIDLQNGKRITYTGVYVLKIGNTKYDAENEVVRNIELGATNRIE